MKIKVLLMWFLIICSSCSSVKTNKVEYVKDTAFGPHPATEAKPSLAKRIWTRMNPLYNSKWSSTKKIAYFVSPLGH